MWSSFSQLFDKCFVNWRNFALCTIFFRQKGKKKKRKVRLKQNFCQIDFTREILALFWEIDFAWKHFDHEFSSNFKAFFCEIKMLNFSMKLNSITFLDDNIHLCLSCEINFADLPFSWNNWFHGIFLWNLLVFRVIL